MAGKTLFTAVYHLLIYDPEANYTFYAEERERKSELEGGHSHLAKGAHLENRISKICSSISQGRKAQRYKQRGTAQRHTLKSKGPNIANIE